jgi:uncharacterized protein DUF3891
MIVRLNGSSQLLITQPDHAALAALVMRQWRADGLLQTPRLPSILLAVEEHDNGWREVDAAPLVDPATGRVLDFIGAPDEIRRAVWPRGVDRLAATPYAAALVAQHALHIYRRYRDNPGWAPFFTEMETRRDRHLAAPLTLEDLAREYFFLRIGDLVSLTFCNGWTDCQLDDSGSGYAIRLDGTRLTITPDPFEGRDVPLEVTARELPNRPFHSAAEARDAFSSARKILVEGIASGSPVHAGGSSTGRAS